MVKPVGNEGRDVYKEARKRSGNFQEYAQEAARLGDKYASQFLKDGKVALKLALDTARRELANCEAKGDLEKAKEWRARIEGGENKGMLDGSFEMTYAGARRIYDKAIKALEQKARLTGVDYSGLVGEFDEVADHDLIATAMMIHPEVRAAVGNRIDGLYRVILNLGSRKNKKDKGEMEEHSSVSASNGYRESSEEQPVFSASLEKLLANIPQAESPKDIEAQRMFKTLARKKAERMALPAFIKDQQSAFGILDDKIASTVNEDLREAYGELRRTYEGYANFEVPNANPEFRDPETGQKGVLPSLHQKIGVYHLVQEQKFGVFDDCGTGKTAIATLAQPIIQKRLEEEGKDFTRTVVVCPNPAKRAWRRGLVGKIDERYLAEINPNEVAIINGERKTEEFVEGLRDKKWIVVNYEQLTTTVNGSNKLFADVLSEMGVDYVIFDESHHIKSHKRMTSTGNATQSVAAQRLAHAAKYMCLLSGSPIPNTMKDYAVMYHLLNPADCARPEDFEALYENNPRILYTLFNEKTIRRTSGDINKRLKFDDQEILVDLDPVQRKLYDHIVQHGKGNWVAQARKALLDPRLVDPEILKSAGVLGKIGIQHSSKYKKLEEILTAEDGPIAKGDNFVIFSSEFKTGVTQREHESLRRKYTHMGLAKEYDKLGFGVSLTDFLHQTLKEKTGKDVKIGVIDGTISDIEEREKIVDQLGSNLEGILCTTETGGESLNFTAANWGIFLDDDYVPKTGIQAVARLLRKGQNKKVFLRYLRGKDTLDEDIRDYVTKKDIIGRMAMDGHPLTKEEKDLLEDTEGQSLGDLVKRKLGGISIDVLKARIEDVDDFEVKKINVRTGSKSVSLSAIDYETTDAQRLMQLIGQDKFGCWQDPDFVELYMKTLGNLSPPVTHRAKISDLIRRADAGQIVFPRKVLSEGSGPSILYNAYQDLASVIKAHGYKVPVVFDRDISQPMLDEGKNPNKILGNMNGENSRVKSESMDMVDNESITLLPDKQEVKKTLIEANRILRHGGLMELVLKNWRFSQGFRPGLERLGFEVISGENDGFTPSKSLLRRLKDLHGEHFASSYANKLSGTYLLLAKKQDKPDQTVSADGLWFDSIVRDEAEDSHSENEVRDPSESRSIVVLKGRGRTRGRSKVKPRIDADREIVVDASGLVQSVRKLRGKN